MADDLLDAALDYARKGWRVLPIPKGLKHPGRDDWQHQATADPERVRALFAERATWGGVGIVTGEASGVWVLDVDVAEGKHGDETLADLEHEHGPLPPTYEVISGRGGRHLYFRWDPAHPVGTNGGRLGPGLDVRGDGGQVLAPPSESPEPGYEGCRYQRDLGGQDEPADAPLWLLELLTAPLTAEPRRTRPEGARGDAPGDLFEAAHTWPELLEADGASLVGVRVDRRSGQRYELWARPGVTDHHGATLYYGGTDVLKVFTSSWPGLDEGKTYTRFGYYAATRHRGDHAAAARQLREEGYVPDGFPRAVSSGDETRDEWTYTEDPATWPEPIPFPERESVPWPIDVLPDWLRQHCEAVALKVQVPVDLCAQLALGVLSSVCMGHVKVEVDRGWQEHVNLYLVTAMPSGAGKSPATKAMGAPLWRLEKELRDAIEPEIVRLEREKSIAVQKAKNMEKSAVLGSIDSIEYLKAAAEADKIEVPVRPKLLIDDATPEVLVREMSEHHGRMTVLSPEAEVFDMVRGTYAKAGKANINVYLKGWSGEPVRVDRKGSGMSPATTIEIEEALLTICVAVQPPVLEDLARDAVLTGRGFTARFMPCVPDDALGNRDISQQRNAPEPSKQYEERMLMLGRRLRTWAMPLVLKLSPAAQEMFDDWRMQLELRLNRTGELRPVSEWVAKVIGSVARLAGLFAVADDADRGDIEAETMGRAIEVGTYWIRQAIGLTTGMWEGTLIDVDRCHRVLRWVAKGGSARARVPMRDLRRAMHWSPEELEDTIGTLEGLFYLVSAPPVSSATTGRPKLPDLVFHPDVWGGAWVSAPLALLAKNKVSLSTTTTHTPTPSEPEAPEGQNGGPGPLTRDDGGNLQRAYKVPNVPEPPSPLEEGPEGSGSGYSLI